MSSGRAPDSPHLDTLAEEFVGRLRRRERPDIEEYARAHPALADDIRTLFPTLLLMEELLPAGAEAPAPVARHEPELVVTTGQTEVANYRVVGRLGHGGMGVVYEAVPIRDAPREPARVAIKIIHPHLADRPGFEARFLREVDLGRVIDHPGVVRTLAAGIHQSGAASPGAPYMVMELVEGETLGELADSMGGRVPEALLRHLAIQTAQALAAIHERGIIHRDLKPANIMVTPAHTVRIMDLGVARPVEASELLSATGQFVGSLRYAAPEQFGRGLSPGPATDLYALGVTLFELATGSPPFDAATPYELMLAHLERRPPLVGELGVGLSGMFEAVIAQLLEKQPASRFASADELARILREGEHSTWWRERRDGSHATSAHVSRPSVRRDSTLCGRSESLRQLQGHLEAARAGEGRVCLLRGEAGIGKTRLVDALIDEVGAGARVLYGSSPPGGSPSAAREAVLGNLGEDGIEDRLRHLFGEEAAPVPPLLQFLRGDPTTGDSGRADPAVLASALGLLLRRLGRDELLVWIVDDLHFANAVEMRIFQALARAVPGTRSLLVGTTRAALPAAATEDLLRMPHAAELVLDRLSPEAARELARHSLPDLPWAEGLADRVARDVGGNPFFLLETVREIRRRHAGGELGSTGLQTGSAPLPVPRAIRDLLELRLRGLATEERAVMECASLVGFEFDPEILAAALGRELLDVLQTLAAIERGSGLVRSAQAHYCFDHHQIQEVLREQLAPPLARAYHASLARAEAERAGVDPANPDALTLRGEIAAGICRHALPGGLLTLGRATVLEAAAALRGQCRAEEALRLCVLASAEDPPADIRLQAQLLQIQCSLGIDLGKLKDLEGIPEAAVAAAEACADDQLRTSAWIQLGTYLLETRADHNAARPWLERARALAAEGGDRQREKSALILLSRVETQAGELEAAAGLARDARKLATATGDTLAEAAVLQYLAGCEYSVGRYAQAEETFASILTLELPDGLEGLRRRMAGHWGLGVAQRIQGRHEAAGESYARALAIAQQVDDRSAIQSCCELLGSTSLVSGRLGESLELYRQAATLAAETGSDARSLSCANNLGNALVTMGDLVEAERWLDLASSLLPDGGMPRIEGFLADGRARIALCRGDLEAARTAAQASLELRESLGRAQVAESHLLLTHIHAFGGARDQALTHATEAGAAAAATGELAFAAIVGAWQCHLTGADARTLERELPADLPWQEAAELHLLLHAAGAGEEHRERALATLRAVEESLPGDAARACFRATSPVSCLQRYLTSRPGCA